MCECKHIWPYQPYVYVVRIDRHTVFLHALAKLSLGGKRVFEKSRIHFDTTTHVRSNFGDGNQKRRISSQMLLYYLLKILNKYLDQIFENNI